MKKLVISIVLVLGVFVAADFGLASVAEYQVSQKMRSELRLADNPSVRINGFPFLGQAVTGDFRDVELEARGVRAGPLNEIGVEANMRHARISPSDVLSGTADRLTVDELDGRIRLKSSDIGRFIRVTDLTIRPAPEDALSDGDDGDTGSGSDSGSGSGSNGGSNGGGEDSELEPGTTVDRTKDTVQLNGSVDIAGEDTEVQVIAVLSLLNGQLKVQPRELEIITGSFGEISLPDVVERSVLQQFTTTLDPGMLPFKVIPTAVRVEPGSLVVEGTAKNVTIGSHGLTTG